MNTTQHLIQDDWRERIRLACYLRPDSQLEAQQITDSAIKIIDDMLDEVSKRITKSMLNNTVIIQDYGEYFKTDCFQEVLSIINTIKSESKT